MRDLQASGPQVPRATKHFHRPRRGGGLPCSTLLVFALAVLPGAARAQLASPGPLPQAHAHLDGVCKACHTTKAELSAERCLGCHQALRASLRTKRGYHTRNKGTCWSCHKGHQGRQFPLISWPGGSPAAFNHAQAGYPLTGKHRTLACNRCHQPALHRGVVLAVPLARRQKSYLGLSSGCYNCHKDHHQGAVGTRCQLCHIEGSWKTVVRFTEHQRTPFPLRARHVTVPCAKCHRGADPKAPWVFRGVRHANCGDCHRTTHVNAMGQGRVKQPLPCVTCHVETGAKQIAFRPTLHPTTVPLAGKHARTLCVKCHGKHGNRRDVPTQCVGCHRDLHQNRFGRQCARCHNNASWRTQPTAVPQAPVSETQKEVALHTGIPLARVEAVSFHNRTRYPLAGRHVLVKCPKCHRPSKGRKRFKGLKFERCVSCHRDVHERQFDRRPVVTPGGEPLPRTCESCHTINGWKISRFAAVDHTRARLPLAGAHRAVACPACHTPKRPAATRYTFEDRSCGACHRDVHRGKHRFPPGRPPLGCDRCHTAFTFQRPSFDHGRAGVPHTGAHARTACASCHAGARPKELLFDRGRSRCDSCHRDPHLGQFARSAPARDCAHCHSTASFRQPTFDHGKRTSFVLEGRHARVPCAKCHHQVAVNASRPIKLFRLGSRRCETCHRSPHGATATRGAARPTAAAASAGLDWRDCGRCHQPTSFREIRPLVGFDHAKTGYGLRGQHRAVSCAACHRPRPKPLGRSCDRCHPDPHRGRLGAEERCAECHAPDAWASSSILARHRRTRLPLTGRHALADCASCHPSSREPRYRGTPASCYGCHAAQAASGTIHPNHVKSTFGQRCEQCHTTTAWSPAAIAARGAALQLHSSVPLTGKHAQATCVDCHRRAPVPRSCVGCHGAERARARGVFDHLAPGFSRPCQDCHHLRGWTPATFASHDARFRISSGKHRLATCAECHTDPTNARRFTCLGACHTEAQLRQRHGRVVGYLAEQRACVRCHRLGRR